MTDIEKAAVSGGKENVNMISLDPKTIISNVEFGKNFEPTGMPAILQDIDNKFLQKLFPDVSRSCRYNILLAKTVEMLSAKRIMFKELENEKLANYFAICFMPSGCGKDKMINDLSKHIFKHFKKFLEKRIKEHYSDQRRQIECKANQLFKGEENEAEKQQYIKTEQAKLRTIIFETNLGTREGIVTDAVAIKKAGFGCIMIKISELGLLLTTKKNDDIIFLMLLYQAYDGIIETKSTKGEDRIETVEGLPVNAILCSDPSMFQSDLKYFFEMLMQTGLIRRSFLTCLFDFKKTIETDVDKAYSDLKQAYEDAEVLADDLDRIFQQIRDNEIYEITEKAYKKIFYPYKIYLTQIFNDVADKNLLQKEVNSRELKVLKVACAFAALNHPTMPEINEIDVSQAINVVEYLSLDFEKYLKHKPKSSDAYDNLFEFLTYNLDKHFLKTKLVNLSSRFGFKREMFRKNFKECIEIIKEMALERGYILSYKKIHNNTGYDVLLSKAPESEGKEELTNLL